MLPTLHALLGQAVVHIGGRQEPKTAVMMLGVVHGKKTWQWARAPWIAPNRFGNAGRYFRVLNCASEHGLSLERWGRL